ncbi:hypothetical protein C9383_26855, partial [Pseudomonas palleroniana]
MTAPRLLSRLIVPTLRVGTQVVTLRVTSLEADAERLGRHSHALRGNDHDCATATFAFDLIVPTLCVGTQAVTLRVTSL